MRFADLGYAGCPWSRNRGRALRRLPPNDRSQLGRPAWQVKLERPAKTGPRGRRQRKTNPTPFSLVIPTASPHILPVSLQILETPLHSLQLDPPAIRTRDRRQHLPNKENLFAS